MSEEKETREYYTYILRCEDNSLYTGITTDLDRRIKEHFERGKKCAKYTMSHPVKRMEAAWKTHDKISAAKLEYHIKTLTKLQKEELIKNNKKLKEFLSEKIESEQYSRVKICNYLK